MYLKSPRRRREKKISRKPSENDTGPGTHGVWGRLTPAQAEAGGGRKEETKEKTEPQPGGEEKTPKLYTFISFLIVFLFFPI